MYVLLRVLREDSQPYLRYGYHGDCVDFRSHLQGPMLSTGVMFLRQASIRKTVDTIVLYRMGV